MSYAMTIRLSAGFAPTVERVRAALKDQGFGVLTEIDMRATLHEKLGVELEEYVILGACNPPLAHRAVQADRTSACSYRATSWSAPTGRTPPWCRRSTRR
ncbi:DUF302 domain-containing protein [Micromonospora sp. WMMB482]|nr:DUF302 domain-containing protein [Micromonospora sp. WMMB482]MBU8861905.1 DUF302 domain-containing protein [Micromonospora sp. WMMB482]MBU8861910.1 DUF302 domain-containing protein [Micromonospora sp. WMMB482]